MKNRLLCVIMAVAMIAGIAGMASAAQDVANTSQKGSLIIFPKIITAGTVDTIVMISNDYSKGVDLQCYWVDSQQNWEDFSFRITKKQPVWFSAQSGQGSINVPPFDFGTGLGELKCWAVSPNQDAQISFNHLYGTAKILEFNYGAAMEYNSWNFTARDVPLAGEVGVPGELVLSGLSGDYDGCPKYLLANFPAVSNTVTAGAQDDNIIALEDGPVRFDNVSLTVAMCNEDLRQIRKPTYTKLKYTIWNEDEVKYTGAWQCAKCWYEGLLSSTENGAEKFLVENLHTNFGMLRVKGIADDGNCGLPAGTSQRTGLVGLTYEIMELPTLGNFALAATTMNGAGKVAVDGAILWDAEDNIIPEFD